MPTLFKRYLIAQVIVLAAMAVFAVAAGAHTITTPDGTTSVLTTNEIALGGLLGCLVPVINGFLTTHAMPLVVKQLLMVVLAAVAEAVNVAITSNSAIFSQETLALTITGLIAGWTAYSNVLKPYGITNNPNNKSGKALLGTGPVGTGERVAPPGP